MAVQEVLKVSSKRNDFILIAHRGGLQHRPENTLAAFRFAAQRGIDWVECDVRLSGDGVPVLVHDERLPDPNGGMRAVGELSYRQLKRIDFGNGESVLRLEELLSRFRNRLRFDIEVKELEAAERVLNLIEEHRLGDRAVVTSFIPEALQVVQEHAPNLARGLLVDRVFGRLVSGRSAIKAAILLGCSWFLPHFHSLSRGTISAAHAEGLRVIPWTVNRPEEALKLIDNGVDGLISDRPVDLLPAVGGRTMASEPI